MPHTGHRGAVVDVRIWLTLDDQKAGKSPFDASQGVIDDRVIARHMEFELGDHSATSRHRDGLNAFQRRGCQTSKIVDLVENLTNHMKRRREIGSAHAEE